MNRPEHAESLRRFDLQEAGERRVVVVLELVPTTLAQLIGHTDAGFTLRVYARDTSETTAAVSRVLERAAGAGIGS